MNHHFNFDRLRNLAIGTVDYVSPSEIKVLLEPDAPQNTALNTGVPSLFPRINGFVLVPNEVGALVGIINWLGVEHSQYPKRKGFKDYDLIDLPFPLRKMAINPIGTLKRDSKDGEPVYKLERGVYSFPSIGDSVILPTDQQLKSIVENDDEQAYVKIGTAPIAANAIIKINPNRLFGRHVAVLGNTGSGKSCSVAGLIRWSLIEAAQFKKPSIEKLNTRFIILDPNGEYTSSFTDLQTELKLFKIEISAEETETFKQLKVPGWLWSSYEWGSFLFASGRTQRPILRQALRDLRNGSTNSTGDELLLLRRQLTGSLLIFQSLLRNQNALKQFPGTKNTYTLIMSYVEELDASIGIYNGEYDAEIATLSGVLKQIANSRYSKNGNYENFHPFTTQDIDLIVSNFESFLDKIGGVIPYSGPDEDSPVEFDLNELPNYIELLAKDSNALQHLEFFILRLRSMLGDTRLNPIIGNDEDTTLESWLEDYLSGIVVIDLSLIPADIIHLVVAVISRIIFEAIQRHRRKKGKVLPTVLMLEEAHNFVKKYNDTDEATTGEICSQVFEKIAREGRKFGLSLMISSQRPSELSPTVLSQCNTFLLHRIVNDRDQDLVKRLVPDNIGGLLSELPILPTRKGILLGWASSLPILVEMKELESKYRPKSDDPDFWEVWTGESDRPADWKAVAEEWQRKGLASS
jgi:DNA helicase HerA-like ATPase